jgi:hypothetical protein
MTIKKSDFLLNFMTFCLGATVGRRIDDPYLMRHLAAKSADLMLVNLSHSVSHTLRQFSISHLKAIQYLILKRNSVSHT